LFNDVYTPIVLNNRYIIPVNDASLNFALETSLSLHFDNTNVDRYNATVITQKEECLTQKDVEIGRIKYGSDFNQQKAGY
jgi:hypothetical protein